MSSKLEIACQQKTQTISAPNGVLSYDMKWANSAGEKNWNSIEYLMCVVCTLSSTPNAMSLGLTRSSL